MGLSESGASNARILTLAAFAAVACVIGWGVRVEAQVGSTIVSLGDTGGTNGTGALLRDVLAREIQSSHELTLADVGGARYILHGSVVELARQRTPEGVFVRCRVSVFVSEAHGGQIRMMLSGRGTAHGLDTVNVLDRAAMRAAVRGALRPLRLPAVQLASL